MTEYVEVEGLTGALADILDRYGEATDEVLDRAVRRGCKVTAEEWSALAPRRRGKYAESISYRTRRGGHEAEGQVGSRMPGLPHLLEKGHAKVGGGRTREFPHVAPAAKKGFEATNEAVDSGLAAL